jgi:Phosphotransferase enzyme family
VSPNANSLRLPQALRTSDHIAAVRRVRADICLGGINDVRDRIACALHAKTDSVSVDQYRYNAYGLSARCSGSWSGRRFFGKILLADPYPIPPRFSAPWEKPNNTEPVRTVGEQIETEWEMTLRMRAFSGGSCVPAPLGKSVPERAIVWEAAKGSRLDHAVKSSRWKSPMAEAGAKALFLAGTWLRNLHEASHRGTETIDLPGLIKIANGFLQQKERNPSHYDRVASKILETCKAEIGGTGTFRVPVAFTHGDFCLGNLLWDSAGSHLAVVDFELSDFRPVCHDLFALVSNLRSNFLNPLIPKSVILSWERSFWCGYGPISPQLLAFAKALALARIFYHHLGRLLTRRERRGRIAGLSARLYRTFLERKIISQRLDLPWAATPPVTIENHPY